MFYGITGAGKGRLGNESVQEFGRPRPVCNIHRILDAADYGVPQHKSECSLWERETSHSVFITQRMGLGSPEGAHSFAAEDAVAGAVVTDEEEAIVGGKFGHLLQRFHPV